MRFLHELLCSIALILGIGMMIHFHSVEGWCWPRVIGGSVVVFAYLQSRHFKAEDTQDE